MRLIVGMRPTEMGRMTVLKSRYGSLGLDFLLGYLPGRAI